MGRHKAVWSNSNCKIDLVDTPDRFQALPGVETGFQDRLMNRFEVLIVWSDPSDTFLRPDDFGQNGPRIDHLTF